MPFDIETAIPVEEKPAQDGQQPRLVKKPGFDIETAEAVTVDEKGMTAYDHFIAGQLDAQVKAAIHHPLDESQVRFIEEQEKTDPGAFRSFMVPYAEGVVGFFTGAAQIAQRAVIGALKEPAKFWLGKDLKQPDTFARPVMGGKPFEMAAGPKTADERARDEAAMEMHPIATSLGQIVGGIAPFIITAPIFPQGLLGTLATFETVGLTGKYADIKTNESLMTPLGQQGAELGIEAIKSGILAPIWHYSGALKFIGRPFVSAVTRASVRGAGSATLSAAFGTDLAQALKEGGLITALSLVFESPMLAKTALGRGITKRAMDLAEAKGFKPTFTKVPGKGEVVDTIGFDVDKMDEAATKTNIFTLVKTLYNLMRYKIPPETTGMAKTDPYARFLVAPSTPETPGQAIVPIVTLVSPGGGQPSAGGMAYRAEKQPIFYSKMMATLAEKMPESASPEQIQGIIKGAGISPDEVDMSNLGDFLKGKEKINKADILGYLQDNQRIVAESWKADDPLLKRKQDIEYAFSNEDLEIKKDLSGDIIVEDFNGDEVTPDDLKQKYPDLSPLAEEYVKLFGEFETQIPETMPKFSQYILPGGNNYREVLFRIPEDELQKGTIEELRKKYGVQRGKEKILDWGLVPQADRQALPEYKSSHWDEKNVLAHARLTDRTTTDGKRVLFVEEIQSDWAREARKEVGKVDPELQEWVKLDNKEVLNFGTTKETDRYDQLLDKLQDRYELTDDEGNLGELLRNELTKQKQGVPSHPLIKHWQPIVLKRLLRYAAENGYDYISWTTGEQQAERYDLSKQIDSLEYYKQGKNYKIFGTKNDDTVIEQTVPNDKLDALVGKEIGKRIREGEGKSTESEFGKGGILEGTDLQIGGEWAKNLYDQQIPNWLNDYLKKFGTQVEVIRLPEVIKTDRLETGEEGGTYQEAPESIQQAVPITPALKQAIVYGGQPLLGKMPAEIGQPGAPTKTWKFIFRLAESAEVINTKGEKVILPKGEEYHTLDVLDKDNNIVPGKVRLQDGKQITVYEGELNKLKGHLLPTGEAPIAGGLTHPPAPEENQPPEGDQPSEDELRAAWETEMDKEAQARKDELKDFLSGKLKYELKSKGEYEDIKHLSWLWAKQGERGYTPDELTELSGMGFDVGDPADSGFDDRVIDLIKSYFNEDIQAKAADAVARADKAARQDKIRINESLMKKYHRDLAKALHIRAIEAAKMVARIEKILSKPLARSKVKQIIRENTGIIKISDVIGEDEALRRLMQREQAVSKEAFRAGKETGREELKSSQAEIKARKEAKEAASEEVNGMIKDIREISHHLGVMPVDYQDAVKEILDQYDIPEKAFKRSTKTLAERDARRRYIQEMEEAGEEVNIPEDELDLLEKITPNDMTVDDLRRVHDTLKRLYYQGKIKNKLIAAMEARDFEETKDEGVKTISGAEGLTPENHAVQILKEQNKGIARRKWESFRNFMYEHLRPEIMVEGLDGWKKGINTKVMWDPLFEAFLKQETDSAATFKKIHDILEPLDLKNAYTKEYDIGKFKGMTKANAYFIYANSFNEHNYQALINSGITEEDIAAVENFLAPSEKRAIEDLLKYYGEEQYQALDDIYQKLNGTHMSKQEFYFPLLNLESKDGLLKDIENQILKRARFTPAAVGRGFTKERVTHKSGFQSLDFFGTVLKNWEQVEHYKAFAPVIRDVRKYLGNLEIREAIVAKFGKEYYDILQKFIKDVAYGGEQVLLTTRDKQVQIIRVNYMKAVLSLNLLSPLRQTLGVLPALHFVGKVPVMAGMLKYLSNPIKWWKFTDEKSAIIKYRAFTSEREMRELIAMRSPEVRLQKFTGATKITEFGMLPLIYSDKVICQIVWLSAYDSVLKKGGSEEVAVAFGNEAVRRTQNMGDMIFLADAFRGTMWDKIFTTFKNENNQNFNLNFENFMKSKENQQSWLHFINGAILLLLLPALLYGWTQRKRIQEDAGEILNDLSGQSLGGLMYLGDIGGIFKAVKGQTSGGINPVENILSSARGVFTASHPETKLKNAIKTICFFYGLPYIGVMRLLNGQPLGKPAKSKRDSYGGIRPIYR